MTSASESLDARTPLSVTIPPGRSETQAHPLNRHTILRSKPIEVKRLFVDTIAHGLWAAALATTGKRIDARVQVVRWVVWWTVFPDVLAFGPSVVMDLWLRLAGGAGYEGSLHGGHLPHAHIGLPLYALGHSLIVFAAVFGLAVVVARRLVVGLSGWLLHILIDIPTHRAGMYGTPFLWPISSYRFDGISWGQHWFMLLNYSAIVTVYIALLVWLLVRRRRSGPKDRLQ